MSTRREFLKTGAALVAAGGVTTGPAAAMIPAPFDTGQPLDFGEGLAAAVQTHRITGASFAYWNGHAMHSAVAGLRNSVTGDPVTLDTLMHVGSITKLANATLMMQLVDDGLIGLDDPVLKHLPELRTRDMDALGRVTCKMLINHTSGIDGEWLPEYGPDQERIVDTIDRCAGLGQLFAPGTETSYNNIATVIAGYLSQKLRGTSWYTLVRKRIYDPLGMVHALVDPLDVPRFRTSIGDLTDYTTGKMFQTKRPFLAPSFAPAGATQMTTATDLVDFARALIGGGVGANGTRILSEASARAMLVKTSDYVSMGTESHGYGLGWSIQPGGLVSHGGGGPGVRSMLVAHPASGRVAALLTNCDRGDALMDAFLDPITRGWTGLKPPPPLRRSSKRIDPARYVGTYENNADRYVIAAEAGGLALRTYDKIGTYDNSDMDKPALPLASMGNDLFERPSPLAGVRPDLLRFVKPGLDGKARFLADGGRLLARVG